MKKINSKKMKFVGVIRKIDNLGRLSISSVARRLMKIEEGDELEQTLCVDENGEYVIMVRKYNVLNREVE